MNGFFIKDKIDDCIYYAYNVLTDLRFHLDFDLKSTLRGNAAFGNIHSNQRCFIIATAPSVNEITLDEVDAMRSEITIGINSMYKSKVLDRLVPTYYSLVDNNYWGLRSGEFFEVAKKYAKKPPIFLTDLRAAKFASAAVPNAKHVYTYAKNYPVKKIRYDPTGNMSISMNVVGYSILLAIYMGFKEIYLIGCDFNSFLGASGTHCYDDEEELQGLPEKCNLSFYLKYYHITANFHYLIARLAFKKSIKIINLSEKSLLDSYPKGDLKKILGV